MENKFFCGIILCFSTFVVSCKPQPSETESSEASKPAEKGSAAVQKLTPNVPYASQSSQGPVYAFLLLHQLSNGTRDDEQPGVLLEPNGKYLLIKEGFTFDSKTQSGVKKLNAIRILLPNGEGRYVAASKMQIRPAECQAIWMGNYANCNSRSAGAFDSSGGMVMAGNCMTNRGFDPSWKSRCDSDVENEKNKMILDAQSTKR